ncbi:transposase [Nonomuraea thailandensis]
MGWDWGNVGHDVTVLAPDGAKIDQWALEHTEHSLTSALARLRRHGSPEELPVAIETTRGLVVDRLLAAGHPVMPIHPNAFNAIRPRWAPPGPRPTPATASNSPTTYAQLYCAAGQRVARPGYARAPGGTGRARAAIPSPADGLWVATSSTKCL